jgi:hypothetical protein
MCGVSPAGPSRARRLRYVPPWVFLGAFHVLVLLSLYNLGRRTVDATLGLCAECSRDERRAHRLRRVGIAAPLLLPYVTGAMFGLLGGFFGVVAGCVACFAAYRQTRPWLVDAVSIDQDGAFVKLRAPRAFYDVVAREVPRALVDARAAVDGTPGRAAVTEREGSAGRPGPSRTGP